ncbi:Transcriptional regulator containing PAS, AAA-type ATPase, and DNA-binding Fis domains [Desulfocicer vacuolatum DSM 3385]|uniref:HTH-type transcriptional regulatory protein TyrR n=1 Tax=Desulfocicer vacuolatum DSM 3385 TaxID=1121400 RepID=A0A1W2EIG8_9BACT|nr:sigma 54-interacting transcriptional regulator [Desulfocicer vacuolatum]SMD08968.1 Transcriptional regulator containing PAS, AAA-type ATPase, and DNA-binding Fis domains [Desulfocicer vacuolatum DSM 3385]
MEKKNKDKLSEDSQLYYLMESIHDNVVITNGQGVIQWVSPSCEETYGMRRQDFIGKDTFEMERRRIWYPAVAPMVLRSKEKVTILEQTKKGEKLVVTGIPILNKDNEIKRVVSYSFDPSYLLELSEQYQNMKALISRYSAEIRELREKEMHLPGVVAQSQKMNTIFKMIMKVAQVETNLLITGESGVGKSLIARKIHQHSTRNKGPFIEINCGSIPENLLESELFGYEPGAYTGALKSGKIGMIQLAHEGTLFLDEIGELSLNLQVKLLKVIQDKVLKRIGSTEDSSVNFRLVAATNQDLNKLVNKGLFREDLFYRLNVVPLHVPPLRERSEDILPLIMHFLKLANKKYNKNRTISNDAVDTLISYEWPGNIRQLKNVVERLVILSDKNHISRTGVLSRTTNKSTMTPDENMPLKEALQMVEKQIIQKAYERHRTTVKVAEALKISQSSAARKIKQYISDY